MQELLKGCRVGTRLENKIDFIPFVVPSKVLN